jgi:hypothetical protein
MRKYLANREKNLRLPREKTRATSAKILESDLESSENGNFLRPRHTIYRGEGGRSKNPPRFNRCEIPEGRVSTPTFRGIHFLPKFESFRGIGSSESTHFLEELMLGNSGKTIHPQNVGFAGFHEISFQIICENNSWSWLFRVNLLSIAGSSNLWNVWNREPAKIDS